MSVSLEDHRELVSELGPQAGEVLAAAWQEAVRAFTADGLARYLNAARALAALGRGTDLVAAYVQEAPGIARELGEDAVAELAQAALALASKTSGAVLALLVSTSPVAARRLGDASLFKGYLQLINQLAAQAPRALRPMLSSLDRLLAQLTLGGLRRWATWGAQAHRTDFAAQAAYFALESPDALAMLQQERKGTLFVDVQRRLTMYLRALWGRDFFLRPTSGDYENREGYQPFIEEFVVHLPDAYDDEAFGEATIPGMERYRAAAAHAAAHLCYTQRALPAEGLNLLQRAVIGVIEDARVETLAIQRFPGLAALWRRFHTATPLGGATVGAYLDRLARALIDPDYRDADPWIAKALLLWCERLNELADNQVSWDIGVALAHDLAQRRLVFNPRTDTPAVAYRDDNRYIWEFDELVFAARETPWRPAQVRKHVNLMEFVNEVDVETAGDDAQEIWVLGSELLDDDGASWNAREGKEPAPEPHHYPEWDYQIQLERPHWTTVIEKRPALGAPEAIEAILREHRPIVSRLKYLIEALQPQGIKRLRKQEDGEEIDINAAIEALVDARLGNTPDPRVTIRTLRHERDLAVLLLLDLSQSTDDKVAGSDKTVLALAREATALLADAMDRIGDPFAIHGFASSGRHDVQYLRFKDFEADYGDAAKARLAAMNAGLSTRMGAALRHAGSFLARCRQKKRLLLVLTDGEPADVDVRDPQYLRADARKAVEQLAKGGIVSYCLSLDPRADEYVSRIFGARNYVVLDNVRRLPEKLPTLYMGLTR